MFDTLFDQKEITKRYKAEIFNEGMLTTLYSLIKKGRLTLEEAAQDIGMSIDELLAGFKKYKLAL